jgi:hypothetical protein
MSPGRETVVVVTCTRIAHPPIPIDDLFQHIERLKLNGGITEDLTCAVGCCYHSAFGLILEYLVVDPTLQYHVDLL